MKRIKLRETQANRAKSLWNVEQECHSMIWISKNENEPQLLPF